MARFEKQGPEGTKPNAGVKPAPARAPKAPSIEDTMFFPKLRRHARWMFVFLAILIGGGLVIAGVGAGGVGVLDVFRDNGSEATSISDARKKTEDDPKDVQAWRDLSIAYQTEGDFEEAIQALQTASAINPDDTSVLRDLASAQLTQAQQRQQDAQLAQYQSAFAAPLDPSGGLQVKGTNALGTDKIQAAVASRFTEALTKAYSDASTAATASVTTYKKIAAIEKDDPNVQIELAQAAESAGDSATAITAYETFLKLAPEDSSAPLVKDRLKQLKPATTTTGK